MMSHRVRRMQNRDGKLVCVFERNLESMGLDEPLPSPAQQLDGLVLWIGDHQPSAAEPAEIAPLETSAWVGTAISPSNPGSGLSWLLSQDVAKTLIESRGDDGRGRTRLRLTMQGWQRFENIKHHQIASQTAFMAMKFDEELKQIVEAHFKPAVDRAGFELRLLTDSQPAGLIDDQLRVALRMARFVIADVTHGNNGAYWEAGFAEGLGKPVIYTCRKAEWDERKVHFDTNHLVTIIWEPDNLRDAADRLTATIRARLPGEATLGDA
jgi:nucleoside 2-deoxyribosyltransferase